MGNFSQQSAKSKSTSYSGLRGTPYEGQASQGAAQSAQGLQRIGMDIANNPVNSQGAPQYGGFTGAQMLPGGQYGLGSNADAAMTQLGKQMFGMGSGSMAGRGFVSPENQAAVVGSGITNALPQLLPQIQGWQQAQFNAPMQVGQYAMGGAAAPTDAWGRLLGSQAQSNYSGSGFGFGIGDNTGKAGIAALMASDRRLKSNIVYIGQHPLGVGIYEYDIFGRRERGVMAQEVLVVKPEAVVTHPDGYYMVDYAQLRS